MIGWGLGFFSYENIDIEVELFDERLTPQATVCFTTVFAVALETFVDMQVANNTFLKIGGHYRFEFRALTMGYG